MSMSMEVPKSTAKVTNEVYKAPVGSKFFNGSTTPAPKKARNVSKKPKEAPVPTDFMIQSTDDGQIEELQQMEIDITHSMSQPEPANEAPKPKKVKKPRSAKQLQHLANMRAKKLEKARLRREEAQKNGVQVPAKQVPAKQAPATQVKSVKPAKTEEAKALKAAQKKKEMEEYFNSLYADKEKVRLAEKDKRRKQKVEIYNKLVANGTIKAPGVPAKTKPVVQPKPKPAVDPNAGKKKRMRFENGRLVTYWE